MEVSEIAHTDEPKSCRERFDKVPHIVRVPKEKHPIDQCIQIHDVKKSWSFFPQTAADGIH
jgi:hypothetical protein